MKPSPIKKANAEECFERPQQPGAGTTTTQNSLYALFVYQTVVLPAVSIRNDTFGIEFGLIS